MGNRSEKEGEEMKKKELMNKFKNASPKDIDKQINELRLIKSKIIAHTFGEEKNVALKDDMKPYRAAKKDIARLLTLKNMRSKHD